MRPLGGRVLENQIDYTQRSWIRLRSALFAAALEGTQLFESVGVRMLALILQAVPDIRTWPRAHVVTQNNLRG